MKAYLDWVGRFIDFLPGGKETTHLFRPGSEWPSAIAPQSTR